MLEGLLGGLRVVDEEGSGLGCCILAVCGLIAASRPGPRCESNLAFTVLIQVWIIVPVLNP